MVFDVTTTMCIDSISETTYIIGPLISDPCCISISIEEAVVVDTCGVRGAGGAEITKAYIIKIYNEM